MWHFWIVPAAAALAALILWCIHCNSQSTNQRQQTPAALTQTQQNQQNTEHHPIRQHLRHNINHKQRVLRPMIQVEAPDMDEYNLWKQPDSRRFDNATNDTDFTPFDDVEEMKQDFGWDEDVQIRYQNAQRAHMQTDPADLHELQLENIETSNKRNSSEPHATFGMEQDSSEDDQDHQGDEEEKKDNKEIQDEESEYEFNGLEEEFGYVSQDETFSLSGKEEEFYEQFQEMQKRMLEYDERSDEEYLEEEDEEEEYDTLKQTLTEYITTPVVYQEEEEEEEHKEQDIYDTELQVTTAPLLPFAKRKISSELRNDAAAYSPRTVYMHSGTNKVWIGGISKDTNEVEFRSFLNLFGIVTNLSLVRDEYGIPKGFAYVSFDDAQQAENIIRASLDCAYPILWKNKRLTVKEAIPKDVMNANKIHVSRISAHLREEDLRNHFSEYGEICDVVIKQGRNHRFAFVRFAESSAMEKSLKHSQHNIKGFKVFVEAARRSINKRPADTESKVDKRHVPQTSDEHPRRLWIGGISKDSTAAEIETAFKHIGEIESIFIVCDDEGRSKGFAYITFATLEAAEKVLNLHGFCIQGQEVTLKKAIPESVLNKNKIYVRGIPSSTSKRTVTSYFEKFGEVLEVIMKESGTYNFAFIRYQTKEAAEKVLAYQGAHVIDGRTVQCERAHGSRRSNEHNNVGSKKRSVHRRPNNRANVLSNMN